jgi:hypothetical protein
MFAPEALSGYVVSGLVLEVMGVLGRRDFDAGSFLPA